MNDMFRGVIDGQADQLLASYQTETPFFFATPEHTLMANGYHARVPQADNLAALSRLVDAELKKAKSEGHPNPVVMGAIPFDVRQASCLFIPRHVQRAGPLSRRTPCSPARAGEFIATSVPAPQIYADGVATAVSRIRQNLLSKVVLARALDLSADAAIDVHQVLERLAARNAYGYTFAVNLASAGQGTLIGASPELLVSRNGMQLRSNPLAGSTPRSKDEDEDTRRSQVLLRSAKDLHEHKVVADAVVDGLRSYCLSMSVPAGPTAINTEAMWHLSSDIRGELAADTSSLMLAAGLHPTPAVCGYPRQSALDLISEIEPFERGYYAGMVGWCDADGNGEWVVTLRCAEVDGNRMRLFAGAGVVAESDPASELAETSAKFKTMLNALGLAQERAL